MTKCGKNAWKIIQKRTNENRSKICISKAEAWWRFVLQPMRWHTFFKIPFLH